MSSARDAKKEREIETSMDIKQLKAIRSSRKGQLTKLEKDVQHYFRTPLKDMKKHTLDGFLTTFEKQVNFYDLAHERILDLVQATVPAEYEYEEKMGEDQETRRQLEANHQALNLLQPDESLCTITCWPSHQVDTLTLSFPTLRRNMGSRSQGDPAMINNSYMGLAYDIERNGLEDKAYPAVRRHVDIGEYRWIAIYVVHENIHFALNK